MAFKLRNAAAADHLSAGYSHHVTGAFAISQFFMSPAARSCPAFLMASDRFDPGGNFFACARASDARATQSWLSILLRVCFISPLLCWRPKFTQEPSERIGTHRVGRHKGGFNMIAPNALKRAGVEIQAPWPDACEHHPAIAPRTSGTLDCSWRNVGMLRLGFLHETPFKSGGSAKLSVTGRCRG